MCKLHHHIFLKILKANKFDTQYSILPATTEGRVAAPPYVPVQDAEVGSVIQASKVVQVAPSHFPANYKLHKNSNSYCPYNHKHF